MNQRNADDMKITLPWPSSKLHAHSKGSHWGKSAATKDAREFAFAICKCGGLKPIVGPVLITYTFFVPDKRRRDAANMIQSCKPYIDGIVDSGLIEGDHWQVMKIYGVDVQIDKDNPRVEIGLFSTSGNGDFMPLKI
jgi:hypothetical protein